MEHDLVRVVAPSGASLSGAYRNLSARSVFVEGVTDLGFDEPVRVYILGRVVEARVAFVAAEPAGVVLTFDAPMEPAAEREPGPTEVWDEDVTNTHEGEELALASMVARAERASATTMDVEPEDPTHSGRSEDPFEEVTPSSPPGDRDPELRGGLQQSAGAADPEASAKRFRAITEVNELKRLEPAEAD